MPTDFVPTSIFALLRSQNPDFENESVLNKLTQLLKSFLQAYPDFSSWKYETVASFARRYQPEPLTDTETSILRHFVETNPPYQTSFVLPNFELALTRANCSKATIRNYRSDINQFLTFCQSSDTRLVFSKNQIELFKVYQEENGLTYSSIRRKLSSLSQLANWMREHGADISPDNASKNVSVVHSETHPHIAEGESNTKHESPASVPAEAHDAIASSVPKLPRPTPKLVQEVTSLRSQFQTFRERMERRTKDWLLPYVTLAAMMLFFLGLGYVGYQQFVASVSNTLAYPSTPVTPKRYLSFQGRLTDTATNPVTVATNMVFKLYDSGPSTSGGSQLWTSGTCSITPDQDGIFNTILGSSCGSEITADVFSERDEVWLQVQVGSETLSPRQRIASVPYALNSETIQGYPISATGAATAKTVVFMDSAGDVVLGEVGPQIRSISGTFSIEGRALTLQTGSGSNGNITLDPDGTGGISLVGATTIQGNTTVQGTADIQGYLAAAGATLSATYAGGKPLVVKGGPSGTANLTEWQNSGGTNLAYVDASGNLVVAGNIGVSGDTDLLQLASNALTVNGTITATSTITGTTLNGTTGINTGASFGTQRIDSSGNLVNIGTTQFNGITYTWPGSQGTSYLLQTNGSGTLSWADPAVVAGASTYWLQNNGSLYPKNSTVDLLVGGQSTDAAKFAVLNLNTGVPVASVSAGTSGGSYLTAAGNLATTALQSLTLGGATTGKIILQASGDTANYAQLSSNGTDLTLATTDSSNLTITPSGTLQFYSSSNSLTSGGNFTVAGDITLGGGDLTTSAGSLSISPTTTLTLNSTGDMTLDGSTDIILDADGADVILKDGGTTFATFTNSTTDLTLDIVGGQLQLANNDTLNAGGITGAAYNAFSNSTTATFASGDNDVYVEDILEVGNSLYVGGKLVYPSSLWKNTSNVYHPLDEYAGVADLVIGGNSTASAAFQVTAAGNVSLAGTTGITASGAGADLTFSGSGTHDITASSGTLQLGAHTLGGAITGNTQSITGLGQLTVDNLSLDGNTLSSTTGNLIFTSAGSFVFTGLDCSGNTNGGALTANGSGVISCTDDDSGAGGSGSKWNITSGALAPINTTLDFLVGGTSTASARAAFININSGSPTATVSAGTTGAAYLTAAGNLATTAQQTLTLGGSTTGDILLQPNSDTGDYVKLTSNGTDLTLATTDSSNLTISPSGTLQFYSSSNSLTSGGALTVAGDITLGGGDLTTSAGNLNITPVGTLNLNSTGDLTIDSTTDIVLDADGADIAFKDGGTTFATFTNTSTDLLLTIVGNQFQLGNNNVLNIGGISSAAYNAFSDSTTATFAAGDNDVYVEDILEAGGSLYVGGKQVKSTALWNNTSNAYHPLDQYADVVDLLLGGTSTTSAKFAVKNIAGGTPTATLSAGAAGGAYLDATGVLQTTTGQTLSLGGSTTGDVLIKPNQEAQDFFRFISDGTHLTLTTTDSSNLTLGSSSNVIYLANSNNSINGSTNDLTVGADIRMGSGGTLDSASGALTVQSGGGNVNINAPSFDIYLDAGGNDILFRDTSTTFATWTNDLTDTTNDLGLDIAGGQLWLADGDVINIGGRSARSAYTSFSDSGTASFASTDNDVYVEGILEAGTSLYVGGKQVNSSALWNNTSNVYHPLDQYAGVVDLAVGGTSTSSAQFLVTAAGNVTIKGTTGISASGAGAGLAFSGSGNHDISASSGTLRIGAHTLTGAITGNTQSITGLGQLTVDNLSLDGNTVSSTTGNLVLTPTASLVFTGFNCSGNTNGGALTANASGVVSCTDDDSGAGSYWQINNGTITPSSTVWDVNIGATATDSARVSLAGSATRGKAAIIVNQTENQDIFAASASGVNRFRIGNDGYVYAQRFVDLANSSYYLDPAATDISLAVVGKSGFGVASPVHQIHADAAITGKALTVLNETGNQSILVASSSGTRVFDIGHDGDVIIGNAAKDDVDLTLYGDIFQQAQTDLTALSTITDTFIYDTTTDSDKGAWTNSATSQQLSWYTETKDDGPNDACVTASDDRCGKSPFPKKATLVTTNDGLYIYDAKDNSLWMKFTQAGTYTLGADTNNNPSSVFALNGRIYVGTTGASATGLYEIDFKEDRTFNYDTTDRAQGDKTIANRNSTVAYSTDTRTTFALSSNVVADVHAAVVEGKTFMALATDDAVNVINRTDGESYYYASKDGDDYQSVWLTNAGDLYGLNASTVRLEKWFKVQRAVSDVVGFPSDEVWMYGSMGTSLATSTPTVSTSAPDALYIDPTTGYTYVGHSQGMTRIVESEAGTNRQGTWSTSGQGQVSNAVSWPGFETLSIGTNNYLYFLGGTQTGMSSTVYKATIDKDGTVGAWSSTSQTQLPATRGYVNSAIATINGTSYIYVIGGFNSGSTATSTIYKATIDGSGNIGAWSTTGLSTPQQMSGSSVVTYTNGNYYIYCAGCGSSSSSTLVWKASIDSSGEIGTWSTTGQDALPNATGYTNLVKANINGIQYLYTIAGYNAGAQTYVYRTKLDKDGNMLDWTSTDQSQFPVAYYGVASTIAKHNGRYMVYSNSGYNAAAAATSVSYRGIINESGNIGEWVAENSTTINGGYGKMVNVGDYLYFTPGGTSSSIYKSKIGARHGNAKYYTTTRVTENLVDDIVGYFPLDATSLSTDTTVTGAEASYHDSSITTDGAGTVPTANASGVRGYAMSFDGGDYLCTGASGTCADNDNFDFAAQQSFALGGWFKHSSSSATKIIMAKGTAVNTIGYKLYMDASDNICIGVDDDTSSFPEDSLCSQDKNYDDSQWHHVVANLLHQESSNSFTLQLYIDGVFKGSKANSGSTGTLANTGALRIGIDADGSSTGWAGSLDELFITNGPVDGSEAYKMYLAGREDLQHRSVKVTDATSATSTTITDSGETWTPNEFVGAIVELTGGTGSGQTRRVVANTATSLTVSPAFASTPSTDTDFEINPHRLYGASNVVTAINSDGNRGSQTRSVYVGTNDGSNGGGVTKLSAQADYIRDIYQSAAGRTDDTAAAWDTTSGYDNIVSIDVKSDVVSLAGTTMHWFEMAEKSFTQVIDELRNDVGNLFATDYNLLSSSQGADGVGTTEQYQVVRRGWSSMRGAGANPITTTVFFGFTFDDIPAFVTGPGTYKGTGDQAPLTYDDCDDYTSMSYPKVDNITRSFAYMYGDALTYASNTWYCFSWVAVGSASQRPSTYSPYAAGADLAEWYATPDKTLQAGEVVSVNRSGDISVVRSGSAYDATAIGIVATKPAITMGPTSGLTPGYAQSVASDSASVAVALAGRVPVKVSLENGPIAAGDALTTSSTPGVAMKATQAGPIIGKAMENFDGKSTIVGLVKKGDSLDGFQQLLDNPQTASDSALLAKDTFKELNAGIGTIMAFVNTSYADPSQNYSADNSLSATGGSKLILDSKGSLVGTGTYNYDLMTDLSSIISGQSFFPQFPANTASNSAELQTATDSAETASASAQIKARETIFQMAVNKLGALGSLTLQELTAARINIWEKLTARFITSEKITSDEVKTTMLDAQEIVSTGLTTQTATISALRAQNLVVVASQSGQAVFSVDQSGSVSLLGNLLVDQNASISGTLDTNELIATSARIATLESQVAQFASISAQTANFMNASISGTLYADTIADFDTKVAKSLERPSLLSKLLGTTSKASLPTVDTIYSAPQSSSSSATTLFSFKQDLAAYAQDPNALVLSAQAEYIDHYLEVNGTAVIAENLGVGKQVVIGDGLTLEAGAISYQTASGENTLHIQPSGKGRLDFLAGLMTLDETGEVQITGNLTVAKDLTVKQTLLTNTLKPLDFAKPFQLQVAGVSTESGETQQSRFEIVNEVGSPVATISGQGRATFAGGVAIQSADLGSADNAKATTNATSGKATLKQGQSSFTIETGALTSQSLIYLTPLGSTNNQVLYVQSQSIDDPNTESVETGFKVGFDNPIDKDVSFTWWIVN